MKRTLFMAFLLSAVAGGQTTPSPGTDTPWFFMVFQQVRTYLQITDAQWSTISANNLRYSRLVMEKQQRIGTVQIEIQQEMLKPTLDPLALGMRYAEIEGHCRDVRQRGTELERANVQVLTDAQKARLKTLDDALKLLPVIAEAQAAGLLSGAPAAGTSIGAIGTSISGSPIPVNIVRSGAGAFFGGCSTPVPVINPFFFMPDAPASQTVPLTPQKWFETTEFKQ